MAKSMKIKGQYKKIVVNEMNKKYNAKNIKVKIIVRGLRRNRKSLKIPNIGYMSFKRERLHEIRNENPFLPLIKVKHLILTEWKQLPARKKMVYFLTANKKQSSDKKNNAYNHITSSKLEEMKVKMPILNQNELKEGYSDNNNGNVIADMFGEVDLKLMIIKLKEKKNEIDILENKMNELSISISEKKTQINSIRLLYDKQMLRLKTYFHLALSKVNLPDSMVSPSNQSIDYFLSYISSIIQSNESYYLTPFLGGSIDHLDISKFYKKE